MQEEQVKKLIQENLENCWKQFARTKYISIHTIDHALCMNSGTPEPLLNSVISFEPSEKKLTQEIEKITHFYKQQRLPFCWWIPSGPLFNQIDQALKNQGFTQTMEVKGMAIDITTLPAEPALPENIRLIKAHTHDEFVDWMGALQIAFDMDEPGANWYRDLLEKIHTHNDTMQCYTAYRDDEPISSLTMFLDKKVASFYNVGTIPSQRGQGLTTAMTHYCLDIARKNGYTWATLQANTNSVRLFQRMGFQPFISYRLYFK